ncbi:Spy/CpxP family protein refolding chaperone [Rhizomicrobium electricum]|uniref:LTXXQ motif family protein n=1 Tax=Rhizomicrobium electricum TaxID=480070 RepID=A0ABP3PJZ4_9PROT|nr:Spy/CpxP family protein refolding chaperone [Rhizomicrobium electricum]NIJ48382.1 Spy/CpxP family protein refolding chaperone [Rhizomicrobium electricum]
MKFVSALTLAAAMTLAAPAALAQQAPPPDRSADFAKHHAEMCTNHYAHAVGKLAELETRLALTSSQKGAFERWKDIKLKDAKAHSTKCADFTPPGRDASIMELRQHQIARLEDRLNALKAETPALEALVKVLTPEQQTVLKRAAREHMGDRMMMMRRFHDGRGPMDRHGDWNHPMQ